MTMSIPEEYRRFVEVNGLFEGFTTGDAEYVALWAPSEISRNNADINISEYAPGFLAFASDGGGEVFAFDVTGTVFMLPLIGMESRYAEKVANSFLEFAARFQTAA